MSRLLSIVLTEEQYLSLITAIDDRRILLDSEDLNIGQKKLEYAWKMSVRAPGSRTK